jgi:hypothetical protein
LQGDTEAVRIVRGEARKYRDKSIFCDEPLSGSGLMKTLAVGPFIVPTLLLAALAGPASSQELRTRKDDSVASRLREMTGLAKAVSITPAGAEGRKPSDLVLEPVFRYDDQPRHIEDATLWVFGRPGRPTAALKMEIYRNRGLYGLVSLAPGLISAKGADWDWDSTSPGIELRPIPDAPAPSDNPRLRLAQLKTLAARFTGFEYEPARGRLQLRLLPRPIYRYDDAASGLQDGAIFSLSLGVNPDVLVLIESRKAPGAAEPTWQYGIGRMGGAEVSVSLDGKEVWKQGKAYPVPQILPSYMNRHLKRVESEG